MNDCHSSHPDLPLPLLLRYINGRHWILIGPFAYVPRLLFIHAGFRTDFNSIPRGLWNILPPTDYGEAAVIHDYLYQFNGVERGMADDIYREILTLLGAPRWKRRLMWSGVRLGGWWAWRKYRKAEQAPT